MRNDDGEWAEHRPVVPCSSAERTAIDEKEIISRVLAGERDLYAHLVRSHQTGLYQLCLAFLKDAHEAEDAAQASFIKAYRSLAGFKGGSAFRTWLTRIGINTCKDVLKRKGRRVMVSLDAWEGEARRVPAALIQAPPEDPCDVRKVPTEAFTRLSAGEKQVLEKVGGADSVEYAVVARELGLTTDAVKGRLRRARSKIRTYLRRHGV